MSWRHAERRKEKHLALAPHRTIERRRAASHALLIHRPRMADELRESREEFA